MKRLQFLAKIASGPTLSQERLELGGNRRPRWLVLVTGDKDGRAKIDR